MVLTCYFIVALVVVFIVVSAVCAVLYKSAVWKNIQSPFSLNIFSKCPI